jgi:flagellar biosynthesis protein FliQ
VSPDQAVALLAELVRVTALVVAPLLFAALISGICVGIVQTATQVNEASITFLVKVTAVVAVIVVLGPRLGQYVTDYARRDFEAVARVVR